MGRLPAVRSAATEAQRQAESSGNERQRDTHAHPHRIPQAADQLMARFYPALELYHRALIAAQLLVFTATGTATSRLNLSPKGMDSLRVLSEACVAYLDLTGSGNETAAHLAHDGRMTLMWSSFDADPLFLRLYGRGRVVRRQDPEWGELRRHFPTLPGERLLLVLDADPAQSSCGYAAPRYTTAGERVSA